MNRVLCIYRRELSGYFNTPIAYIFIPIFVLLVTTLFFIVQTYFLRGQASMRAFFDWMPYVMFLFVPGITMRLWSEELRVGTAEILLTLPYKVWELVIGKFLAGFTIVLIALALTAGVPVAVAYTGDPDWGPIICGYVGSALMGGMFVALGSMISAMTKNQVVALVIGWLLGFMLVIFFGPWTAQLFAGDVRWINTLLTGPGVPIHFQNFQKGVLSLSDCLYFAAAAGLFLSINIFRVESRRY